MLMLESDHYIFHYHTNSVAEKEIESISALQESCYAYICKTLNLAPEFKIEYFLCNSPDEVGNFYGDNEPCNGFARMPNKIYAVYNEQVKCIGFHEDAHMISYCVNRPPHCAVREGLAMFFDRKWWGISNHDWTLFYLKSGQYIPIDQIIENDDFLRCDCSVTYPIMGAFTEYLILSYGSERYMKFYQYTENVKEAFLKTYGKPLSALNNEFVQYTEIFSMDEYLFNRISVCANKDFGRTNA